MASPVSKKEEIKKTLIAIVIAMTPVTILASLFWHSPKKPKAPVEAVDSRQAQGAQPLASSAPSDNAKKKTNDSADKPGSVMRSSAPLQQEVEPRPVTAADIVAKAKSVEREKLATARRRHVSVLPDPQPKEPEVATVASPAKPVDPVPERVEPASAPVECTFRKFPGIVEHRTYPSAEMCDKAQKMWREGSRLLEPDGSINERYVVQKDPPRIPGMSN